MVKSLVLFGDPLGAPRLLRLIDRDRVRALVRASIRPEQEGEMSRLARAHGLPLLTQPKHDSAEYVGFLEELRSLEPDMLFVDSYSMLLRHDVLAVPKQGAINVHGALLPDYRGPNPTQWALLNDARETGVTVHHMDEGFDTGDIIGQTRVPIRIEDTWVDVQERIAEASERLLTALLPTILAGDSPRRPQDERRARAYRRRSREDGRIDWDWSVLYIYNLVRALVAPHPGAFYISGDQEVVIDSYLTPSQIAELKFGSAGGRELPGDGFRLVPLGKGPAENRLDRLQLTVESMREREPLGTCALRIDWDSRQVRLEVCPDPGDPRLREAETLAREFARRELELSVSDFSCALPRRP